MVSSYTLGAIPEFLGCRKQLESVNKMELRGKEEIRHEILQSWLKNAWVYPTEGPNQQTFLRLTPGGRLKMRRRIKELENSLGVDGAELVKQDEEGTLTAERDKLELVTMVQSYISERRFIESQGGALGKPAVKIEEAGEEEADQRDD